MWKKEILKATPLQYKYIARDKYGEEPFKLSIGAYSFQGKSLAIFEGITWDNGPVMIINGGPACLQKMKKQYLMYFLINIVGFLEMLMVFCSSVPLARKR